MCLDANRFQKVFIFVCLTAVVLLVGVGPICAFPWNLTATNNGGNVALEFTFTDPGGAPEFVGFDIYRYAGIGCAPTVLNAEPFPRLPGLQTYQFVDLDIDSDTNYRYRVRLVDAGRQPLYACSVFDCGEIMHNVCSVITYANTGAYAPLYHGTLEDWGWGILVNPCPGSCGHGGFISSSDVDLTPYLDTDIPVQLYGSVSDECGVEGDPAHVTAVSPTACALEDAPISWGGLKSLYR